jgi:hypothetical protein
MIILLVPELEALLSEVDSAPRLLSRLLARGRSRALDRNAYLAELVTDEAVGPAAIARHHDRPQDASGCWIFADPVMLQPDLNAVWVQPHRFEPIDQPAVTELQALLAASGANFELIRPDRAYVGVKRSPTVEFTPPWGVAGRSMDHVLPSGRDAAQWIRILNECQMLLHQHAGQAPQTPAGLWFWGSGSLPETRPDARVSHLIGTEEGLKELAGWLELSYAPEESGTPDASLRAWSPEPQHDVRQALEHLDDLIRPLWRRLLIGSIDALELASRQTVHRLTRRDAWQFWKRVGR